MRKLLSHFGKDLSQHERCTSTARPVIYARDYKANKADGFVFRNSNEKQHVPVIA